MTQGPEVTAAATFCATLVDEWVRAGVRHAIVCPGSRSTPMALALAAAAPGLDVQVVHDERSAGFMALGVGLPAGEPAVVLTTSGTAAAELHPAVVEADLSGVPMIVCTADRPPELQDVGAPQTIDQVHLFGRSVRWFAAPEVPDDARAATWRPLAARAVAEATGARPGPVHLNLAFRDPLVGVPGALPEGRADGQPWSARSRFTEPAAGEVGRAAALLGGRKGVIIAGGGELDAYEVHTLAAKLGWPVVVSPRSVGVWDDQPNTIAHADALVRVPAFAAAHRPDVVLQLGGLLASRLVAEWLAAVPVVAAMGEHEWVDPGAQVVLAIGPHLCGALCEREWRSAPAEWLRSWTSADAAASHAIATTLAGHLEPTEPAIARDVVGNLPEHTSLVVSSSMPIRDVEWYVEPGPNIQIFANRGANGIDGVVSTAVGVALTARPSVLTRPAGSGGDAGTSVRLLAEALAPAFAPPSASVAPTAVLVGDVAFLHDSNALLGLAARGLDLTVIVIDNDGGGIFSFLPQGTQLPVERFEQLFGTPHGVDLTLLAEAHGIPCQVLTTQAEVGPAVAESAGQRGARILIVRTDRVANVAVHAEIHAAVAAAL